MKHRVLKRSTLLLMTATVILSTMLVSTVGAEYPWLQDILNQYFGVGVIDVNEDETGDEIFSVVEGDEAPQAALIAEIAGFASRNEFGWYPKGDPSELHVIFQGADNPDPDFFVVVEGLPQEFGLYLKTPPQYLFRRTWRSQTDQNTDGFDHFWTFDLPEGHGIGIIAAMEDLYGGGDGDYNDMVVVLKPIGGATAIELASFAAQTGVSSIALAWETGTEVDNAGFNVYRATASEGPYTKINDVLIPAEGDPVAGASYRLLDKGLAAGTYYYLLQDVDYNGVKTQHGPASATVLPALRKPSYRPAVP